MASPLSVSSWSFEAEVIGDGDDHKSRM